MPGRLVAMAAPPKLPRRTSRPPSLVRPRVTWATRTFLVPPTDDPSPHSWQTRWMGVRNWRGRQAKPTVMVNEGGMMYDRRSPPWLELMAACRPLPLRADTMVRLLVVNEERSSRPSTKPRGMSVGQDGDLADPEGDGVAGGQGLGRGQGAHEQRVAGGTVLPDGEVADGHRRHVGERLGVAGARLGPRLGPEGDELR